MVAQQQVEDRKGFALFGQAAIVASMIAGRNLAGSNHGEGQSKSPVPYGR